MKHTLSVLGLKTNSGPSSRISGLFARRGFNIAEPGGGPAEGKGVSRADMVWKGIQSTLQQMNQGQLNKLVSTCSM